MVQIINISQARSQLSTLVKQVAQTKNPIIILQDSKASVVIVPYEQNSEALDYVKSLQTIKGDWFSQEDYGTIRSEIAKRKFTV